MAKKKVAKKVAKKATKKKVAKKATKKKVAKKATKKTSKKKVKASNRPTARYTDNQFLKTYKKHKGNVVKIAEELKVARTSVYKRCAKLDKEPKKLEGKWDSLERLKYLYKMGKANFSEMARISGLARQTIMRRCKKAGLKPAINSRGRVNRSVKV